MQIKITAGELMNRGIWIRFCELTGTNDWALAEGLADSDTEFNLTEEHAYELGILSDTYFEWGY